MNEGYKNKFVFSPKFRVISTWIFFPLGAIIVILTFMAIYNFNIGLALGTLQNNRHLYAYIELVSVGLLPLIYTIICRENPSIYGINIERKGLIKSILLSMLLVVFLYTIGYLTNGTIVNYESHDFQLNFPWNVFYFLLGVFAWGPLEVFFIVYLIKNTDKIFNKENKIFSYGLIITTILFALCHILTTQSLYNAFYTGSICLVLGLIFKYSKNSIGPMLAWTLINGQIWFISQMLWL